ncbi:unnamed protein product [Microthlaspi erraticum]|uniref:Uncharacterized protein n=1 Tax=Microthlaspi erraticum TaxID=1685480 RepID=A0A6D2K0C5_9BRAS|nr:unnamed protein product [Microthlaspi erraticum]
MFRARPNHIRPSEVSAKVPNHRPITHHDPGNIVPRSAKLNAHRARPNARAGKQASRPRNLRVPRPMHPSEPGRTSHVRPRISSANLIRSTTPADRESVRPRPFRLAHDPIVRPIVPHDRPNAAVDPKPFLKPKLMFSSPA